MLRLIRLLSCWLPRMRTLRAQVSSRLALAVNDIEVHDCIESSPYRKFLCHYQTSVRGRQLHSSMLRFDMTAVRPDPMR